MHSVGPLINDCIKSVNAWLSNIRKYFRFGKLLEQGIDCYNQENYQKAQAILAQALELKPDDFTVNFWYARTAVMLSDYELAEQHLQECKKRKPQLEGDLLSPWFAVVGPLGNDTSPTDFVTINEETDKKLYYYHYNREYNITDIVSFFYLIAIGLIPSYFVYRFASLEWEILSSSFLLLLMIIYYVNKPLLPANLWIVRKEVFKNVKDFIHSRTFYVYLLGYILLCTVAMFLSFKTHKYYNVLVKMEEAISNIPMITKIERFIQTPIIDEIVYRGVLFVFLKQYDVPLAYIVAAIISTFLASEQFKIGVFISSIVNAYIFNKYKSLTTLILLEYLSDIITLTMLLAGYYIIGSP